MGQDCGSRLPFAAEAAPTEVRDRLPPFPRWRGPNVFDRPKHDAPDVPLPPHTHSHSMFQVVIPSRRRGICGEGSAEKQISPPDRVRAREDSCSMHVNGNPAQSARLPNKPVVVFTSTRSPLPMYSGTMISMPVLSLAGFGRLVAVPPLCSGGVSTTSRVKC